MERLFEVPNLDCISIDPDVIRRLGSLFTALSLYCDHKATAMEYRLAGQITAALVEERRAETIYDQLPEAYRW